MRFPCRIINCPKGSAHRRFFTNADEQKFLIRENGKSFYINQKTNVVHIEEAKGTVSEDVSLKQRLQSFAYKFFLPAGYPKSVHSDYPKFYSWTALQGTAGSASYVLSTQSLLTAIGIGQELALPGAAAISWVLKDGLGSVGMMLLASKFGTRFDIDTKRTKWRADVIHNVGVGLELITPLFPKYFLILASLANVAKGLAGITSGATRAALNKHFSRSENLGDITAKAQTQGIATYLIGMCAGIGLSTLPWNYPGSLSIFTTFGILASVHIYASYRALSSVSLSTLNNQRSSLLISEYLHKLPLSTPDQLRSQDFIISSALINPHIKLGSHISESVSTIQHLPNLLDIYSKEQYILNYNNNIYFILLKDTTESRDIMKAYFNAHVLFYLFNQNDSTDAMTQALQFTNQNFPIFIDEAHSKNWNSSQFLLFCHDNKIKTQF